MSLAGGDTNADSVLHVIETLELDGDILDDSGALNGDESFENESFLSLHKDPACSSRYFVTHDYGVHAVVVPLVDTLADLAAKKDRKLNLFSKKFNKDVTDSVQRTSTLTTREGPCWQRL